MDTRQTGLIAKVIDDNLNSWEDFSGQDINVELVYPYDVGSGPDIWEQAYWGYRGQASMCARTTDGALVRVRLGDGTASDRKVYRQIITDPTDTASWLTWTSAYAGDHYAVAIDPDATAGAGYHIYSAKTDGLYMDGVKVITLTGIIRIKTTFLAPGLLYFQTVGPDSDGDRMLRWYYTPDARVVSPVLTEDCAAYRWYRHDMVALRAPGSNNDYYHRIRSMALEAGARHQGASEWLTSEWIGPGIAPTAAAFNEWSNVRHLKGPSGEAGFKTITNLYITSLTQTNDPTGLTSFYYLFYNERERDLVGNVMSNLRMPLFWSRSVGYPYYLSQPTPTGYSVWGFAGAVAFGDYIYAAGNGRVIRRSRVTTELDLTNYVIEGNYSIPRDGAAGTGKLVLANPKNIVGAQLGMDDISETGMTERRLLFALGTHKAGDVAMSWKRDNAWWIARLHKLNDGIKQQVEIDFGDFWHRMENPFRDTYSRPGRFTWSDWAPEETNHTFDYSNSTHPFYLYSPSGQPDWSLPRLRTLLSGDTSGPYGESITLFGGWRGENASIRARFWQDSSGADFGGFVFRYQDDQNFYRVGINITNVYISVFVGGIEKLLTTIARPAGNGFLFEVDFRWKHIRIYREGVLLIDHTLVSPVMLTGFAGLMSAKGSNIQVSNLVIEEFHTTLTTMNLVRTLLAYVDEHQVEAEDEVVDPDLPGVDTPQIDIMWGIQSDLDTPGKALRQLLEAARVQVVWKADT